MLDDEEKILGGEPIKVKKALVNATNYMVKAKDPMYCTNSKCAKAYSLPGWAFLKKEDGKTFQLDKKGNRIPVKYLEKVDVNLRTPWGKKLHAYFYNFENY